MELRLLSSALLAASLAGCALPYRQPLVERAVAGQGVTERAESRWYGTSTRDADGTPIDTFDGFDGLVQLTDPTRGKGGRAILITVHGMCHHDRTWFEESTCRLAQTVDQQRPSVTPVPVEGGSQVELYRSDIAYHSTRAGQDRAARIYGIVYSGIMRPTKQSLCRDVDRKTDVCPQDDLTYKRTRAAWNAAGKNELMNNCIADAVVYLGPTGEQVRQGVASALAAIAKEVRDDPHYREAPIAVLTESLGSKVLSDVLFCAKSSEKRVLDQLFRPDERRVEVVFYGANQIPLLNLGFREPTCRAGAIANNPQGTPGQGLPQKLNAGTVVAFTDPNDLLSYEIDPTDIDQNRQVYNVIVSNAPAYLGLGSRPDHAHTWYRANPGVAKILMCGIGDKGTALCPFREDTWLASLVKMEACAKPSETDPLGSTLR